MKDLKFYICLVSAVALLFLSAALPLVFLLGGGMEASALTPPTPVSSGEVLALPKNAEREMRGLWIATVNNINFPSRQGLSAKKLAAELSEIVDFAAENGFNTILFQVRPAADALYRSDIFPASRYVSGKVGTRPDGDFDCLAYLLQAAKEKGIAVYAWVNPLRVTSGSVSYPQTDLAALPAASPAVQNPNWVVPYADGKLYFDAGIPAVRELVSAGVREICERYDVDGIIFDDYFYPYPQSGAEFDDADTFATYGADFADLGDFRRDSVNRLVRLCYETVKDVDADIRFGVSPFGIWQNSNGTNGGSATAGLSAYDAIFCDALAWARDGYVDFLAPQLYWSFDTKAAPYETLCDWWSRALDGTGVTLYVNHGVYRYAEGGMESGELTRQVAHARTLYGVRGGMYYGYAALRDNAGGVTEEVREAFATQITHFDYRAGESTLTVDTYKDGDRAGRTALIAGQSDPAYPVSVNGITPLRRQDGSYSITLALAVGENRITVANGADTIELFLTRE